MQEQANLWIDRCQELQNALQMAVQVTPKLGDQGQTLSEG